MITIIGAAGHIGNVLTKALVEKNKKVRAIVMPGENYDSIKDLPIEIVPCDIRNREALDKALEKSTVVYHLAGLISIGGITKEKLIETNYEGTRNVLDACVKNKVKKLIYVSSIHAFEDYKGGQITEECKIDPALALGDYGCTKAMATNLVLEYAKRGDIDARIACPTGVLGPYDYKDSEMGHLVKMYLDNKLPYIINGSYDFVDVRDVANGLLLIEKNGSPEEIYLLPGNDVDIKDFFKMLSEITGYKKLPKIVPDFLIKLVLLVTKNKKKNSSKKSLLTEESVKILQSNSNISGAKAIKNLGYKTRNLSETLKDTVSWMKEYYKT